MQSLILDQTHPVVASGMLAIQKQEQKIVLGTRIALQRGNISTSKISFHRFDSNFSDGTKVNGDEQFFLQDVEEERNPKHLCGRNW